MALQPDVKVLIPASSLLARFEANGSPDLSFSGSGRVPVSFPGFDIFEAGSVAAQPDGKILVGGSAYNGTFVDFALARYNLDGTVDSGFRAGGKLTTDFAASSDELFAMTLQADGKILTGGRTSSALFAPFNIALARYQNTVLTPAQMIQQLITNVDYLVNSGSLSQGE